MGQETRYWKLVKNVCNNKCRFDIPMPVNWDDNICLLGIWYDRSRPNVILCRNTGNTFSGSVFILLFAIPCPKHNHHIAMLLAPFSFSRLPCLHNSTEIWQPFSILKIYIYLVRIPLKLLWWVLKHHQWKRERIYLFESAIKLINLISLCVHLMKKQKFNVQTDQFFRK